MQAYSRGIMVSIFVAGGFAALALVDIEKGSITKSLCAIAFMTANPLIGLRQ